jgi:chromosome segregation ATPase
VSALTASEKQLKQSLQSEISNRQSVELELVRRNSALQSDRLILEKLQMDFDNSLTRVAELTEDLAQSKQRMRVTNIELLRKNEDIANYQSTIAKAEASESKLRYDVSCLNEQTLRQSAEIAELRLNFALTEEGLRAELNDKVNHIIELQSRKDSSEFQSEQNKSLYLLTKSELSKASMELSFTQKRFEESEGLRAKNEEALRAGASELARCRSELNDCRTQLSTCTDEMQQGRSKIATLTNALRESRTSHDFLESSARGDKIRLESSLSELSVKNTAMEERIGHLQSQSLRSRDEMQSMELDRRRLLSNLEELQALLSDNKARKEAEVLRLEDDLKRVLMKCDSLIAEVAKNEKALSHSSNLLVDKDSEVDRLTQALRSAETQVKDKDSLLATDEEAIKKCRAQIEQLSSDLMQSQGSIAKLTNELRGSAEQVLKLQSDRGSLQSEIDGLHATIRATRSEGVSANEEIRSLRNLLSSLSEESLATASKLNAKLEDVTKKLDDSHLQLKNLQLKYKDLETQSDANSAAALKEIKSAKDELTALSISMSISMQAAGTAFEKDIQSARSQIQTLTDSKFLLESENRRLQSAVGTKEKELLLLSDQVAALQLQTVALDDQMRLLTATSKEADQLKTSLTAKQAACDDLLEQNESLSSQLRGSSEQLASMMDELARTKSLLNSSEEKVVEFGQSKTKLEWKIKSLTDDSRKVNLQLQIAQEDIQENRKELERCRDLLNKKTADYQSLSNELLQTKAQMNAFNMEALARGEIAIPEYEKDDFESAPDIVYSFQMV